ncbi:MAG: GWxTD domain-containing protein [Rhodothermales bacterium]|nr:GWxTD domain-containing protein [Rhodothermales bacterium]MBO6781293.1 GWxTD domain-containing protein [Rhodothermales bacterium]
MSSRPVPGSALLVAVVLLGLTACSGGLVSTGEGEGWTRYYEEGVPDFDFELVHTSEDSVRAVVGLIPATLVFRRRDDGAFRAAFRYHISVDDRVRVEVEDSLVFEDVEPTRSFERLAVESGLAAGATAVVSARLTDRATGRTAVRSQTAARTANSAGSIGRIGLGLAGGLVSGWAVSRGASPVATAHVRALGDGCVEWALVHVPTDTSVAVLPYALSPSYGSRAYRGALYSEADTLSTERVPVRVGSHVLSWKLPALSRSGVHRVELSLWSGCTPPASPERAAGRSALTRPEGFPRITRLDQMIDALTYLATEDEMQAIREAGSAAARKEAFDAFWGRTVGDPILARRALANYYSRVEEANRLYSGFKEGWKTDRGMVYLVMGPPLYVEDSIDQLRWFYSYDERNPGRYFVFDRVRGFPDELNVPHYVLNRSMEQEREWRLAVQRWRRGEAR